MAQLADDLCSADAIDASREEAEGYLGQLVKLGVLRFRAAVPDQEPEWELALLHFVERLEIAALDPFVAMLRRLGELRRDYQAATAQRRAQVAGDIDMQISDLLDALAVPKGVFRGPALYEDATAKAEVRLSGPVFGAALSVLAQFLELTAHVAHPHAEQAAMRAFFEEKYGPDAPPVDLLRFYEDFHRDYYREHLANAAGANRGGLGNPFKLAYVDRLMEGQRRLSDAVVRAISAAPTAEEVQVSLDDVRSATSACEGPAEPLSCSVFLQAVPPAANGQARLLVQGGQQLPGFGKYLSRFLYLLPAGATEAVRSRNRQLSDGWLAEIEGDGAFNANLHPCLLDHTIAYPAGDGQEAPGVACGDLVVCRAPEDDSRLWLQDRTSGKRVIPVDLGFLNPRMRPPLFQLLSTFSTGRSFGLHVPDTIPSQQPADQVGNKRGPAVTHRPRVVLEGAVIIARRRWTVKAGAWLCPLAGETPAQHLLRLSDWRDEHGIPRYAYLRVQAPPAHPRLEGTTPDVKPRGAEAGPDDQPDDPHMAGAELASDGTEGGRSKRVAQNMAPMREGEARRQRGARGSDWLKPQFVDFQSPMLVDLFSRMVGAAEGAVILIDERLPTPAQLPHADGVGYACEFVMQYDAPRAPATGADQESGCQALAGMA